MRTAAVFALCLLVVAFSAAQDYSKFPAKELAELMQKHEAELIPGKKGVIGKPGSATTLAQMPDGYRVLLKALDHYAPMRDEMLTRAVKNQALYTELKRREGINALRPAEQAQLAALEKNRRELEATITICQRSVVGILESKKAIDEVPDESLKHLADFIDPDLREKIGKLQVHGDFTLTMRNQTPAMRFLASRGKRAEVAIPVLRKLTLAPNEEAAAALKKIRDE